jgi:hypothetical protein
MEIFGAIALPLFLLFGKFLWSNVAVIPEPITVGGFMHRRYFRLQMVTLLLAIIGFFCFAYFSLAQQQIPSEAADPPTVTTAHVFLNGEPFGTLANLIPLKTKLQTIFRQREKNGVFVEDTNEIEKRVILMVNPRISVLKFAEIGKAITDNYGDAYVEMPGEEYLSSEVDIKPNPLILLVSTDRADSGIEFLRWPPVPKNNAFHIEFFDIVSDPVELKSARINGSGIEISSNGQYFINERPLGLGDDIGLRDNTNYGGGRHLQDFVVRQRPIDLSSLGKEVQNLVKIRVAEKKHDQSEWAKYSANGNTDSAATLANTKFYGEGKPNEITIVASEKVAYSSLIPIFKAARDADVSFSIIVRKMPLK